MSRIRVGFLAAVLACSAATAAQQQTIRAADARARIGSRAVVHDAVAQVVRNADSAVTHVNFGAAAPNHSFRAVVPDSVRLLLEPAVLAAAWLRVEGLIVAGAGGKPEIVCASPGQLAIAGVIPSAAPPPRACCRVCTTGKACGNSCIARNLTCRQPAGCACNG